jgi:hypothetical protein
LKSSYPLTDARSISEGLVRSSSTLKIPESIDFERYGNRSWGADLLTTM